MFHSPFLFCLNENNIDPIELTSQPFDNIVYFLQLELSAAPYVLWGDDPYCQGLDGGILVADDYRSPLFKDGMYH